MNTLHSTLEALEGYRRRDEEAARRILTEAAEPLRAIYPATDEQTLFDIALNDPEVRRRALPLLKKARSIAKTIRTRQRREASATAPIRQD